MPGYIFAEVEAIDETATTVYYDFSDLVGHVEVARIMPFRFGLRAQQYGIYLKDRELFRLAAVVDDWLRALKMLNRRFPNNVGFEQIRDLGGDYR